jgi:DNA polymerase-3 subunit gamma/tau
VRGRGCKFSLIRAREEWLAGREGVRNLYQVLYRKWRPQVFADVVGQPQVTVTLKNELMAGRVAHAYLFTGSRGTGKTTCAKILAKAVNCLTPVDGDPCGHCEICQGMDQGSVLDIVEIDAASNNGVENIRSLREEANFTPAVAKYRVYIIDEVHMLSVGAFNALLKTLEEPPAHVVFILATTEVHKLPATILSRCQRFDFRRIPPTEIAARLEYVASQEGTALDSQAGLLLARLADGALRDALSLLDQCIGVDKAVTVSVVNQVVGIAGREPLFQVAEAVHEKNAAAALEIIDDLHRNSKDMMRLCEELCSHFRSLMLIKTMKAPGEILAVTKEELEELTRQALPMELSFLLHSLDVLQRTMEQMGRGSNQRIELEMALIRLCTPELDTGNGALVRRIEALERKLTGNCSNPNSEKEKDFTKGKSFTEQEFVMADSFTEKEGLEPVKRVSIPQVKRKPSAKLACEADIAQSAPPPEASPTEEIPDGEIVAESVPILGSPDFDMVPTARQKRSEPAPTLEELCANAVPFAEWPEVLQLLKEYSRPVSAAFQGSAAYCSGHYMLIEAKNSMAFELLRKEEQRKKMRDTIRQVTGRDYKLGPYKKAEELSETQDDPLELLAKQAEAAGISVIKK